MATQIGSLVIEMSANVARLQQDMQQARQQVEAATGGMSRAASNAADTLRMIGAGISVTGVVYAVKEIGLALIDAQGQIDKFRAAMGSVGSMDVSAEFEFVRRAARDLGIDLVEASNGYTKLAAAARGTSLAGDGAREIFIAVAKAATTLGLSSDETSGALMAISQMMSKGTVQAEELRGQLGERLPGAFQIAARAMGVSTAELSKMLEQGQVISEDFLPKFAKQLEQELGAASVDAAQSASRELVRLKNGWQEMVQAISDSGASGVLGKALANVAESFAAVAENMRIAKAQGAGFFGQMVAGITSGPKTLDTQLSTLQGQLNDPGLDAYTRKRLEAQMQDVGAQIGQRNTLLGGYQDETSRLAGRVSDGGEAKAVEQLRGAYAALAGDLDGQNKNYQKNLAMLNAAREKGIIDEATYVERVKQLIKEQGGVKDALKSRTEAEKAAQDRLKDLNAAQLESLGINKDYAEKVGLLVELWKSGRLTTDEYTEAIRRLGEAQPVVKQYTDELARAEKERFENLVRMRIAEIERVESVRDQTEQIRQQAAQEEQRTRTLGLSGQALVEVMNAEADLEILRVETLASLAKLNPAEAALADAYATQVEELKRLKQARADGVYKQEEIERAKAAADAAKQAEAEWKRAADGINNSLTDALLRGFESGKGFGENLASTLKNMFRTLVLRPVISAVLSPVSQGITSAMQAFGVPASGAATSGGGVLSGLGSMWSSLGSMGTNFAMSGVGEALGLSTSLGVESAVAGTSSVLTSAGSVVSSLGAAVPYIAAAVALYSLFSGKGGGPKSGGQSILDLVGGSISTSSMQAAKASDGGRLLYTPSGSDAQVYGLASGALGQIAALANQFGGSANDLTLGLGFDTDPQGSAQNRLSSFLGRGGATLYSNINQGLGRDEQALQAALADEVSKLVVVGLASSDLPGRIGEYFSGLDLTGMTGEQARAAIEAAQAAQSMADAVRDLGGVFGTFSGLTVEARGNIAALTGGLDQFVSKTQSFVANYFSQEEQAGISAAQILRQLGASGIDASMLSSKSGFRSLVDSLDLSTSSGQTQLAALLNTQGAFSQISDYLSTSGMTLGQAAALSPGGAAYEVLVGSSDSAANTAAAARETADAMTAMLDQNAAAYRQMIDLLGSINTKLADAGTAATLSAAEPVLSSGDMTG